MLFTVTVDCVGIDCRVTILGTETGWHKEYTYFSAVPAREI